MRQFTECLKELAPERRWSAIAAISKRAGRRTEHGSTAFEPATNMMQPQDGAVDRSTERVKDIGARLQSSSLGAVGFEPEDARLTGGTRSLMRRALGLNFRALKPKKIEAKKSLAGVKAAAAA
jgi:hypothetical protein